MQTSPSLADFMARLDEGPRGANDALAAIDKCAADQSPLLDLQQMELTDEDLQLVTPRFSAISSHVKELNLFMNECVNFRYTRDPPYTNDVFKLQRACT